MVKLNTGNCLLQLPGCCCSICCTTAPKCPEPASNAVVKTLPGVLKAARAVLAASSNVPFITCLDVAGMVLSALLKQGDPYTSAPSPCHDVGQKVVLP